MEPMIKGLDIAANAVGGTLGPCGRNVFIDNSMMPAVTNDGATVADQITLSDKLENAGAWLVKNITAQTNDDAGDGTTTTAVLLQSIVHECLKRPENPMAIKNSLKKAGNKILKELGKKSIQITKDDILKVAKISSEDETLAKIIDEIIKKLGNEAVIDVEDSKTFATTYDIINGYEAAVGFMSPYFITDTKSSKSIAENVAVLVTEKKISNIIEIQPIFTQLKQEAINHLVIVCEDIDPTMLGVFVNTHINKMMNLLVIRATGPLLKDIEGVTGAKRVSDELGLPFKDLKIEHLGKAKKVVSSANTTLFVGESVVAELYAKELEDEANNEPNMYAEKQLRKRIMKIRGTIATLRIGAPTDLEREFLKYKADDAIKAVKCAIAEGVVEGGGMTLWRIAQNLKPKTIGEEILKKALTSPLEKICENGGKSYAEIVMNLPEEQGYDAKNDTYVYMMEAGIIDPAKVERCALENAVSSASQFITTFCVVCDEPENKK